MFILYRLRTTGSNKTYIGQHSGKIPLTTYFKHNLTCADSGSTRKPCLYRAIRKHGANTFTIEVIGEYDNLNELNAAEQAAICAYGTWHHDVGYNLNFGGGSSIPTLETRRKISESRKGMSFSEEHRRNLSEAQTGRKRPPYTAEARRNMSEAHKGQPWSEARRAAHIKG